ncbi:hypothetical protein B0H10DRAFT_2241433 [Mycena sp. CBHHK59/15]|nr:hypothetical protein B0H10DRAFT_2241433 [Mycena sp. CBHHK59/15]
MGGRFVVLATRRRTVHVFAVNPYGRRADVRGHLSLRVRGGKVVGVGAEGVHPFLRMQRLGLPVGREEATRPRRLACVVACDSRARGSAPHIGAAVSVSLASRGFAYGRDSASGRRVGWRGVMGKRTGSLGLGSRPSRALPPPIYISQQFSFDTLGEDYDALIWRFQFDIDAAKLGVRNSRPNPDPHDAGLGDGKQRGRSPPARRVAEDMRSVEASVLLKLDEGNGDFVVLPSVDDVSPHVHADWDNDDALPTMGRTPDKDGLDVGTCVVGEWHGWATVERLVLQSVIVSHMNSL